MVDPLEAELQQARRMTRRKTWFWVLFFVLLGVGGRLAYFVWTMS